jgi:hypothetical protein
MRKCALTLREPVVEEGRCISSFRKLNRDVGWLISNPARSQSGFDCLDDLLPKNRLNFEQLKGSLVHLPMKGT